MDRTTKIATLNANGLRSSNDPLKRRKMFRWLKTRRFDVIFIQETHSDSAVENIWQREWGGQTLFAHGDTRSRGVAILFNPSFRVDIKRTIRCENGRFIIALVSINMCEVALVCSYGPNIDNPATFSELVTRCDEVGCSEVIWGGDFNFVMENIDRISTARCVRNNNKCRRVVKDYMAAKDLIDIWRHVHSHKQEFTFCRSNPTSKSRLDFFLVSSSFLSQAREPEAKIADGYLADHKIVAIKVMIKQPEVGRSYWKFNNSSRR